MPATTSPVALPTFIFSLATLLLLPALSRTSAFQIFPLSLPNANHPHRHNRHRHRHRAVFHEERPRPQKIPNDNRLRLRLRLPGRLASTVGDNTADDGERDGKVGDTAADPSTPDHHDIAWRAFRANLVQNGIPTSFSPSSTLSTHTPPSSSSPSSSSSKTPRYAYESTPLLEKGTILLSVPTADLCQALEQQYWHKCVVLLTEIARDPIKGELERKVPREQLADGEHKGRWSYRGIVLNRVMDVDVDVNVDLNVDPHENWILQRGGDLLFGIPDCSEEMESIQSTATCLYYDRNTNDNTNDKDQTTTTTTATTTTAMKPLLENLYTLTHQEAKRLCQTQPHRYRARDFITFAGFCSWRPGQLEMEMTGDRMEWLALSVDGTSVWEELQLQLSQLKRIDDTTEHENHDHDHDHDHDADRDNDSAGEDNGNEKEARARRTIDAGTDMWRNLLSKIDYPESKAIERLPRGQLRFYDEMLKVWAEDNLHFSTILQRQPQREEEEEEEEEEEQSTDLEIGPGALLRSRPHCSQRTPNVKSSSSPSPSSTTSSSTSASPLYPNDTLLYEQEFLKSTILILEDTPEATVGLLLNHPMAAEIDCVVGKEPLPLRYGGPMDVMSWKDGSFRYDDDDDDEEEEEEEDDEEGYRAGRDIDENGLDEDDANDDNVLYDGFMDYATDRDDSNDYFDDYDDDDDDDSSPFVWIHRNQLLGSLGPNKGGGTPLGTSNLYQIRENDAISALQSGLLPAKDVMVFSGVCLWEKGPDMGVCGGGLREQVDVFGVFEIVRAWHENDDDNGDGDVALDSVWDILSKQRVLTKETFDDNVDAVIAAWNSCRCIIRDYDDSTNGRIVSWKEELSEAALRAWVGVNLLDDPLGTLVEIKAKRDNSGRRDETSFEQQ